MRLRFVNRSSFYICLVYVLVQGVVYLEMKNMTETDMDSLRIRLIPAVQESDQDQNIDQDSESSARRHQAHIEDEKEGE